MFKTTSQFSLIEVLVNELKRENVRIGEGELMGNQIGSLRIISLSYYILLLF